MKRCAIRRTPAAAAIPSAVRPALELPIRIATADRRRRRLDLGQEPGQVAREVVEVAARRHDVDEPEQRRLELGVRGGEVHRLVVDHLQRVAGARQRVGEPPADLEQLALNRRVVGHSRRAYAGTLRRMDREPELLSVVAPMYEEQDTVDPFTERVAAALEGVDYELILVDDGSKDAHRGRDGARRGGRPAREGRRAVAQLRPPAGADRRARARPRRRDRDARRRPAGPAGGDPGDARPLARGRRRRLRRAPGAAGGDRLQARHRARLLPRRSAG